VVGSARRVRARRARRRPAAAPLSLHRAAICAARRSLPNPAVLISLLHRAIARAQAGDGEADAASGERSVAAVLAQPPLVDAIRARIAGRLDALAFEIALSPRQDFALDYSSARPLCDLGAAELAEALAGCGQVTGLGLPKAAALYESGIAHLARLRSLRSLDLAGCFGLTDAGIRFLWRLTALTSLGLANSPVTDAGLAAVAQLTALRRLDILGCEAVTAAGIGRLSSLVRLTSLRTTVVKEDDIEGDRCWAEGRAVARLLPALPALARLAAPSGGRACLAHAGRTSALRMLELHNCDVADLRLIPLVVPCLTQLHLVFACEAIIGAGDTAQLVFREDVALLCGGLTALADLTLLNAVFHTTRALEGLKAATARLEALSMKDCVFLDDEAADGGGSGGGEGLRLASILQALPGLFWIELIMLPLCDADLDALATYLAPSLRCLSIQASTVTVAGLQHLSRLSALTDLRFWGEPLEGDHEDSTPRMGTALACMAAAALPLTRLSVSGGGLDLSCLTALSALSYLDVSFAPAGVIATLTALAGGRIASLSLEVACINDASLSAVATLAQLTSLRVQASAPKSGDGAATDRGLVALRDGLRALISLELDLRPQGDATEVSDAGLDALLGLPALRRLVLATGALPAVTADGAERVRASPALLSFRRGTEDHHEVSCHDEHFQRWA